MAGQRNAHAGITHAGTLNPVNTNLLPGPGTDVHELAIWRKRNTFRESSNFDHLTCGEVQSINLKDRDTPFLRMRPVFSGQQDVAPEQQRNSDFSRRTYCKRFGCVTRSHVTRYVWWIFG